MKPILICVWKLCGCDHIIPKSTPSGFISNFPMVFVVFLVLAFVHLAEDLMNTSTSTHVQLASFPFFGYIGILVYMSGACCVVFGVVAHNNNRTINHRTSFECRGRKKENERKDTVYCCWSCMCYVDKCEHAFFSSFARFILALPPPFPLLRRCFIILFKIVWAQLLNTFQYAW